MNRARRTLVACAGSLFLCPRRAIAQGARSSATHRKLGMFFAGCDTPEERRNDQGLKVLAELGYVEGRNLTVEYRCFDMDFSKAPGMAAELVRLKVDALLTAGTPQTQALLDATRTIPIVTSLHDPVASGITRSLKRPDRNVTGLALTHPDMAAKDLDLIRKVVPKMDRLVYIDDDRYPGAREFARPYEAAARSAGLPCDVRIVAPAALERVLAEMKRSGTAVAIALFVGLDPTDLAKMAYRHRVPMWAEGNPERINEYVNAGGLMGRSVHLTDTVRRISLMVDKVLRGVPPADIPWELPDQFYLAINVGTAKLLGLTIPQDVMLIADHLVQ